MPITACSYFQYQEYPEFMTFFYVGMYLLEIIFNLCFLAIFLEAVFRGGVVAKKLSKSEEGLLTCLLPWRCDKSQHCGQLCANRAYLPLTCIFSCIGITMMTYISTWNAPGFGVSHSAGTGMLYFGSDWNVFPIPS